MNTRHAALSAVFPFLRWPAMTKETAKADLAAGLTGALIVLPQGVAFATIAGLPPEFGLYAAMVPAIVAALLGSSWHLVTGPTTAISIAVFASVSPLAEPGTATYISLVLTLTFLTGLFQLLMGLARLGGLVNFISHTVVIGFTAGAAVLIALSQVNQFFGLEMERGLEVHEVLQQVVLQVDRINPYVVAVGVSTLAADVLVRRVTPRLYMIVAMVLGGLVALMLNRYGGGEGTTGIETVGALSASLPPLSLPDFSPNALGRLVFPALIVTMLALTEAVSISRAIAVKSGQHIDPNPEFVGQGLSNLFGSFFSSYASSGSFNRSGVNYAVGARTPLAAILAPLFLVILLLVGAPLAAYLPTAAMAAVLFLLAYGLIDFTHIRSIFRTSRQETVVMLVTFFGTLIDLEKGIFVGIILSLALYLYRISRPGMVSVVPDPEPGSYYFVPAEGRPECPQYKMIRIHGSIFFGAVSHVQSALKKIDERNPDQKHVLLISRGMNFVDVAGAEILAQEAARRRRIGGRPVLLQVAGQGPRALRTWQLPGRDRRGPHLPDQFSPHRHDLPQARQ